MTLKRTAPLVETALYSEDRFAQKMVAAFIIELMDSEFKWFRFLAEYTKLSSSLGSMSLTNTFQGCYELLRAAFDEIMSSYHFTSCQVFMSDTKK